MFRGRFTITNEEPAPTQQWQHQSQGGAPMQRYDHGHQPTVFGQSGPVRHQAGDERWVETVSYSKTSTNDTSISLQKAANRQADGSNSHIVNLLMGCLFAAVAGKAFFSLIERSIELFAGLVLICFAVGFFALKGGLKSNGGNGGAR